MRPLNTAAQSGTPTLLSLGVNGEQWWINGSLVMGAGSQVVVDNGVGLKLAPNSNCNLMRTVNQDGTRISDVTFAGRPGSFLKPQHGGLLTSDISAGVVAVPLDRHPGTDLTYPLFMYLGESYETYETVTVNSISGPSAGVYTANLASPTTVPHTIAVMSSLVTQKRVQANRYLAAVLQPLNVDTLYLGGYKIFGGNFVTVNPQGCNSVDINFAADALTPNQDGVDLFGCSNVRVRNITGITEVMTSPTLPRKPRHQRCTQCSGLVARRRWAASATSRITTSTPPPR